jgi:ribosomal protein L15
MTVKKDGQVKEVKFKDNSKTSLLVKLVEEGKYNICQLIEKTAFTKKAIYSIIYYHLPKRGVRMHSVKGIYKMVA